MLSEIHTIPVTVGRNRSWCRATPGWIGDEGSRRRAGSWRVVIASLDLLVAGKDLDETALGFDMAEVIGV